MQFGIIGTGVLGGLFAGALCANGEGVRCFDVDRRVVDAIDERGLRVERIGRDDLHVRPEASTSAAELGTVDVAFVFTKLQSGSTTRASKPSPSKIRRRISGTSSS